jgi:4-methyl-5(b-hydroxyethyl)-thiazole monophosphate biosynthesis
MVFIHLANGFEEIEALTVVDLLRRVDMDVRTVSVTGEKNVEGAHGIRVVSDLLFEEADYDSCDMIVLPGGLPGAFGLRDHEGLKKQILRFQQEDRPLAAICAAPLVFGSHGVLKGRRATIYPGMEENLTEAETVDAPVVQDGNLITSQGPGTAMAFALQIVEFFCGKEKVENLKQSLLWERR